MSNQLKSNRNLAQIYFKLEDNANFGQIYRKLTDSFIRKENMQVWNYIIAYMLYVCCMSNGKKFYKRKFFCLFLNDILWKEDDIKKFEAYVSRFIIQGIRL